jgi:hypothetical protein
VNEALLEAVKLLLEREIARVEADSELAAAYDGKAPQRAEVERSLLARL